MSVVKCIDCHVEFKSDQHVCRPDAKTEPACGDCRFWLEGDNNSGYCRRMPPVVVAPNTSEFPLIYNKNWCGEFR